MVVSATLPLHAACSLTLVPVPSLLFLVLSGPLVSDSKQAEKDKKGKPEKLLQHVGELNHYNFFTFLLFCSVSCSHLIMI